MSAEKTSIDIEAIRARDARWDDWFIFEPPPREGPIEPREFIADDRRALLSRCAELEKERDSLRAALPSLVDTVWQAATDSQEVPSRSWALELIEKWLAALSANPLTSATGEK